VYIYRGHTLIHFIRDIFDTAQKARRPVVSFEFFPTKTPEGERALLEKTIPALRELHPDFCSVTYGAGGSTRENTLAIVDRIQREQQITTMAHLTRQLDVDETRGPGADKGARHQERPALRGDPPPVHRSS
jgi:methylenetetrahydrofolate reductase (NADPH)